ncbi:winged helix-turn-helix domain-containing protein [Neorhizobium sp. T786]|uniref:winged helix-turn-helix domain-containing protein n=1 Tax=Pseudorhizobium xiangyangii TaxID=2883104 RepID=UPI001CFF758A|nr:winged helix-turn-helix domain-containing protein [Neorhizobium xiangyangii]MCB5204990.1 winged helix-turn-helix domain-containing protein [Neorhizobium xiangyangii]
MIYRSDDTHPALVMRLDFPDGRRLGRGKIQLLDNIRNHGSISAGGRAMDMSYRRAWMLVDEMNRMFAEPVVVTQRGGSQGGRAVVTPFGNDLILRFRAMERQCRAAIQPDVEWLLAALRNEPPPTEDGA